ncbi:cysteine hydrolase family protein [Siccirubricoccus sp. G192]|uniref:cysteine hydrolase family protein n=1 Tax=Siccirubricoccus sp. G192 TaxID=2849651 RepID=UPI001C2BB93D|nr:cysteine hydrolase [Siccirubricoccus sp. G192]MBV1795827.1 cysteine hydrolase [Siccirubricoccus sp. G192]
MAERGVAALDAKPGPLELDLSATAMLVVDMQNDFGATGGMFDRAGIDISVIRRAIAPTARVISAARAARLPVIYVKEELRPDLSDIGAEGSPHWRMCQRMAVGAEVTAPDGRPSRIHVAGTWNTEILPELTPRDGDVIVAKRRWSAFYGTELDARLRALGVRYLVVTGCTTSLCIESTIRDAAFRDYICVLPADCTGQPARSGSSYSGHEESLKIIERSFGWLSCSESVSRALEGGQV